LKADFPSFFLRGTVRGGYFFLAEFALSWKGGLMSVGFSPRAAKSFPKVNFFSFLIPSPTVPSPGVPAVFVSDPTVDFLPLTG